jgi:chromate transporter
MQQRQPTHWQLFRIWAAIGLQSFGGGASTTFLIQQTFIEKRGWLSMEEFLRLWNLCLLTPGINLVAVTTLIGKKLGGVGGIAVSLAGLLLPSAAITCLLTAGFQSVEHLPAVQAMLKGIVPATGGIMLVVAVRFAAPLMKRGWSEGKIMLLASVITILAVAATLIILKLSVVIVIIGAALLGSGLFRPPAQPTSAPQTQPEEARQP